HRTAARRLRRRSPSATPLDHGQSPQDAVQLRCGARGPGLGARGADDEGHLVRLAGPDGGGDLAQAAVGYLQGDAWQLDADDVAQEEVRPVLQAARGRDLE